MRYLIRLEPSGHEFHAHAGEPILEAAERAHVPMEHGCRVGACRTCVARLLAGHVAMPAGTALTEEQLATDLVLPCVAVAQSNVLLEIHAELGTRFGAHPLPWTE
jgi:ferredoxin